MLSNYQDVWNSINLMWQVFNKVKNGVSNSIIASIFIPSEYWQVMIMSKK